MLSQVFEQCINSWEITDSVTSETCYYYERLGQITEEFKHTHTSILGALMAVKVNKMKTLILLTLRFHVGNTVSNREYPYRKFDNVSRAQFYTPRSTSVSITS